MGIHISCDSCYKTIKEDVPHVVVSIASSNPRFPVNHKAIYCIPCMKDQARIYFSVDNPNFIAPPPSPETTDEVKSSS